MNFESIPVGEFFKDSHGNSYLKVDVDTGRHYSDKYYNGYLDYNQWLPDTPLMIEV